MKRSLLALAAASVLLACVLGAPMALAADGVGPVVDPAPSLEPTTEPDPTPTPSDGNGEIVIDPTFITATATPAATPRGDVRGATARPRMTPPATNANAAATTPGTSLQVLVVLGVAGSFLALLAGRVPAARRR